MTPPSRNVNFGRLLFGGDYNPEQWKHIPGIWDEDMRLMQLAHVSAVAIGIFSWAELEPEEGRFEFGWMDDIFDRLHTANVGVILATPSGAKPAWMAAKYEEIRRVGQNGLREPQNGRHNHCPTSTVYREKVRLINGKLAERCHDRPNLLLWHLSNEYGGYCYCDLCFGAFREWLKVRYNDDLEALNRAWWTRFWSHTYTEWEQINFVDKGVHGLDLDWKRFMSDQCADFMQNEIAPLRAHGGGRVPVTTNFMGTHVELDYHRLAPYLDIISWDSYPNWHNTQTSDAEVACQTAFHHDLNRGLKNQPFLLMECTPSLVNWQAVSRPKRPGVHRLAGLQAVAHGSDSVLHFQWRKSRGSSEKFHGAIVDHVGHENNRVFRESAALGQELADLAAVAGSGTPAQVALVYDWENRWAIDGAQGPRNQNKNYEATCVAHYKPFWARGIAVDVVESLANFDGYKVVVAPMLYMLRPGVAERLEAFVKNGGTLIVTYLTGITDESDLCFLGGFPGPLRPVLGVWAEETDVLHDNPSQDQTITPVGSENEFGLTGVYTARQFCDVLHAEGAQVLATYDSDYYAGSPAVTVNAYGKGHAYYIASRNDDRFASDFLGAIAMRLDLAVALPSVALPEGVTAQVRQNANGDKWVFLLNFTPDEQTVDVPQSAGAFTDAATNEALSGTVTLAPYGAHVLQGG